jgi:hypothetical protein
MDFEDISLLRSSNQIVEWDDYKYFVPNGTHARSDAVRECILLEVLQRKKVVTLKCAIFTGLSTEVVEEGFE